MSVLIFAGVLLLAAAPVRLVHAHGGPPLRIGVSPDPDQRALGRIALAHLRDGVGYAVDWRAFPDREALAEAFAAGRLDILIGCAGAQSVSLPEPVALPFPSGNAACGRLGVAIAPGVLEDVRFTILRRELVRLLGALTPGDLAAVEEAERVGGERAAAAAARAVALGRRLP